MAPSEKSMRGTFRFAHSFARVFDRAKLRAWYTEGSCPKRVSPPQLKTYVHCLVSSSGRVKIRGKEVSRPASACMKFDCEHASENSGANRAS